MKKQGLSNHRRYYFPHHFVLYPVLLALIVAAGSYISNHPGSSMVWIFFVAIIILSGWISFMMRQHYALTLQNRIVRLEMRLRYYQLTGTPFERYEDQLTFSQVAALRFSSDEELPELLQRAIADKLPASEIKKQIRNWQPDHMRV